MNLKVLCSAFAVSMFLHSSISAQITRNTSNSRPNIVLVLADDLGVHDLGCYGADLHQTPNIDTLAANGVQFLAAYSPSPVCSPTRAAILTGKHPARLGMTIWSEGSKASSKGKKLRQADSLHDLPHSEVTLAEHLQAAGWLCATIGKWHLGDADHAPETQGFDINIGGTHWGAPHSFFWPYRGRGRFGSEFRYVPHLDFGKAGEYLTDRLTAEAEQVITRAAANQDPFFLLFSHHAPHTPIEAKTVDVKFFTEAMQPSFRHQNATYAAMVRSLDESVGRIVRLLDELKQLENTLIVFASDNGGYIGNDSQGKRITDNHPLRSGKGSLYEGGIRVPLILHWPNKFRASEKRSAPVVLSDLFPTLLSAVGLSERKNVDHVEVEQSSNAERFVDSYDLLPYLLNELQVTSRSELMFHYPHYYHAPATTPCSAIRSQDWKLIEYFEDDRVELYNLEEDPSEATDLARSQLQRVTELKHRLSSWRTSVGAKMPQPNPAQ